VIGSDGFCIFFETSFALHILPFFSADIGGAEKGKLSYLIHNKAMVPVVNKKTFSIEQGSYFFFSAAGYPGQGDRQAGNKIYIVGHGWGV
jgi:hypothetical protein